MADILKLIAVNVAAVVVSFFATIATGAVQAAHASDCGTIVNPCMPDRPADYAGSVNVQTNVNPTICLDDDAHDLMSIAIQNGREVRLPIAWDYGLYFNNGQTPEVYPHLVRQRCQERQTLVAGTTRIIVWFNCIDRRTGKWVRHWLATTTIHDNSTYYLTEFATEPASGFEDEPRQWRLPS